VSKREVTAGRAPHCVRDPGRAGRHREDEQQQARAPGDAVVLYGAAPRGRPGWGMLGGCPPTLAVKKNLAAPRGSGDRDEVAARRTCDSETRGGSLDIRSIFAYSSPWLRCGVFLRCWARSMCRES